MRQQRKRNKSFQNSTKETILFQWLRSGFYKRQTHRASQYYTPLQRLIGQSPSESRFISGYEGPTERLSSFVDSLLQPVAKVQKSYLKDTTEFIKLIERTKVPENIFVVSMDVTSLYTNIPQEKGITIVCNAYELFHENNPPIPTALLREILGLILKENSFQFNGKKLSSNAWNRNGHKNGSCFCQYIHVRDRNSSFELKEHKTTRVKTIHRRRDLFIGH